MKKLIIFCLLIVFAGKLQAQTKIAVKDAAKHIGETVTICDKVFSGKLVKASNIVLNMAGYDTQTQLTVMIPGTARNKFKGSPEADYCGKDVIVTGKLTVYNHKPQIIVTDPKQLKIVLIDDVQPQKTLSF